MVSTLRTLLPGQKAIILTVHGEGEIHRRLLDMGLVRGMQVIVEKIAPLGDPIQIRLQGSWLSLRKEEAENIEVEVIESSNANTTRA